MEIKIGSVQPAPVQKFEGVEIAHLDASDLLFLLRVARKPHELHAALIAEAQRRRLIPMPRCQYPAPGAVRARL